MIDQQFSEELMILTSLWKLIYFWIHLHQDVTGVLPIPHFWANPGIRYGPVWRMAWYVCIIYTVYTCMIMYVHDIVDGICTYTV